MTKNAKPIRIGLSGFGQTGRQIYAQASQSQDIEVVVIADIGKPEILHYLLCSEIKCPEQHKLQGNFLVNPRFQTRMIATERPASMPWDIFDVDIVIDATGKYRQASSMQEHIDNGAPRVLLRSLPVDTIDRIVIPEINGDTACAEDRLLSAGSATTQALCLLLKIVSDHFDIECASMTSIHSYTNDQALQNYAGSDFRRSRSAAENIIPNTHEAYLWLEKLLPKLAGKVLTYALNVPIREGCLLDVNLAMKDAAVTAEQINDVMRAAVPNYAGTLDVTEDLVVSSDVIGSSLSLLFDAKGTIKAGTSLIKTLSWYGYSGHAARLLDVVRLYSRIDQKKEAA